jgi:hypothetical protein
MRKLGFGPDFPDESRGEYVGICGLGIQAGKGKWRRPCYWILIECGQP